MKIPIPITVKQLWDSWNLRAFILLSLSLQTFLILFAPFRKRTANKYAISLIWSAYLLADWAASFAVGLISSSQSGTTSGSEQNGDLLAFWAPFLLLHLGGPDTITAFALEDNELWLRHLLGLVFQAVAAAYVFFQSLPVNNLWVPTMLLFIAGLIKYAERTRALYLASLERFRESMLTDPDPGPNYAKLMEEYASKKKAGLPTTIKILPEPDKETAAANISVKEGDLKDIEVVQYAYRYFKIFRGLLVDLIFSFRERNESRKFFLERNAKDAFRLVEVELNYIYEVLFTKVEVVHCLAGYIFRFISFTAVLVVFGIFYTKDKHDFHKTDIAITYALLIGAIALDSIALFMLIFSDWTVAAIKNPGPWADTILSAFLAVKSSKWWPKIFLRRWSQSFSTYNLIDYCVKQRSKDFDKFTDYFSLDAIKEGFRMLSDFLGLTTFLDQIYYVHSEPFSEDLRDFIFEELRTKSDIAEYAETTKEICAARGNWILRNYVCSNLLQWIDDVDYDESLLLWHIATELCLYTDEDILANPHKEFSKLTDEERLANPHRNFSKLLSDYMLYLLVMQPTMMSAVAGIGQIRYRDTCAEAIKFFKRGELKRGREQLEACKKILDVNTDVRPGAVKGDRSKSVLFDACMLAKELSDLKDLKLDKWEIISKVWVEMLSYAATNCRPNTHAQQVSKGGELVTFVWLLMAHFGLGQQFQIKEGHARAKLIVDM